VQILLLFFDQIGVVLLNLTVAFLKSLSVLLMYTCLSKQCWIQNWYVPTKDNEFND